ncbi:MAG: ribosomal protein L10, large subunit ribosomal protein L10 [Microgenomates group bacterium GW2011_GWC1_43_13]|uniref:Large ribosomal subunit protein uL10 n=3 Tax=Candidatus Woeseibacteriota TaxID=1752722 RepID=A0A837IF94_9BACT|nr:MAG: ribosomal protein L10, large subunit ribosomal protein L10 [Microgenomates group bacterium GW2011_GWC1_43_13]KKT33199.1 MAG: 50S ribosomal protein L10 [Candidatus Woesebacteria bacterium GW2011_GWB1_44_11]KKT54463.1 MAG: 50S ribosomal protein L10 [Candidatus Woesebacteria bacterium GW2011_GWA1_44_23]OGM75867.1 MAG: 50S ribosomal protein L10 [Candidatus Woesebacteria bacterium RIFOXYA1_FULL_43_16]OGM83367.1 MAG: 50S ribosomal protein L10 [Candidatus Woesebacteria bacterium RIFOXYB1_FULL_
MKKAEKIIFVDNLKEELKDAKSVVLVNYAGLAVKPQQELKRRLAEVGGKMIVVKNTLLSRAGEAAGFDSKTLTDEVLSGQTALIVATDDPVAPIQTLGKFAKEFEVPKFKIGVVEGSFQDTASLTKLAALPGRDALLGQLLGTLMAPKYGLVQTLNGNLQKLVYVLSQASKKGSGVN